MMVMATLIPLIINSIYATVFGSPYDVTWTSHLPPNIELGEYFEATVNLLKNTSWLLISIPNFQI